MMEPKQLIQEMKALVDAPPQSLLEDDFTRRELRDTASKLSLALETGGDTVHRLGSLHLQLAMARIGIEMKAFQTLSTSTEPYSPSGLAAVCNAETALMERLLRYWASFGMVSEVGEDEYAGSKTSMALTNAGLSAGVEYFFEMINPTYVAFPEFLRRNKYINTTDPLNCPWQIGWDTKLAPFQWMHEHPQHMGVFMTWMTAQREDMPMFLDAFDFEKETGGRTDESSALFVDIGGATGHQCAALKARLPNLPGRVILQDQPPMVALAPKDLGFEAHAYDFWTPQPVQGAAVYYLRNILHNHPDDKCEMILRNTKSAMAEDSVILIDEMIIPPTGAHWRATQLDITMMTCLAARERTLKQWQKLIDGAGLMIKKVVKYTEELGDSIIVVVPKVEGS